MCEPFEKTSSMLDCGPHTPEGYVDLWAVKAYASRQDAKSCPASLVTGEPVVKVGEGMNKKKNKLKRKNFSSKACAGEGANKMSSGSNHQLLPSQPGTEWKTWAFLTLLLNQSLSSGTAVHGEVLHPGREHLPQPCISLTSNHPIPPAKCSTRSMRLAPRWLKKIL